MTNEIVEAKTQTIQRVSNPFGTQIQMQTGTQAEGQYSVQAAREIAEVQGMVLMAKKFPRDRIAAVDKILNDCTRPKLAEEALYSYARSGNDITGPSIRLAECIAQNWGNIDFGIKELEQSNGKSKVMAFAWDLETNARQTKIFDVPHVRKTKKMTYALEDPRDIYELVANNGARRLRACILGIVPGDVIDAAVAQCEATMSATADISPENVAKMLKKLEEFGVTKTAIEKRIQRRVDAIQPAQMVQLRKIYKSLQDGMANPADFFEMEKKPDAESTKKSGIEGLKDEMAK